MPDIELGPQVSGDNPFLTRLRLHQSWWRAERLCVPWGTGPRSKSDREIGNMLRTDDAEPGLNFLTPDIHAAALSRIEQGPGVDPFRCTHNLLSSQPMCFNLFGPLVADLDLALELLNPLLPVKAKEITDVRVEYAPEPASEYLDDRTAFDAFVEFVDEDGGAAFVGIETKLSEPFSQKLYDTARYREITEAAGSPWKGSPPELADRRWNQLWRNQLLVEATRRHPSKPHGVRGWLAVVYHPDDPSIGATMKGYWRLLANTDSLLDWPLDVVVAAFAASADESTRRWLHDFEDRYLRLDLSAAAQQP